MCSQIQIPTFCLKLPEWVAGFVGNPDTVYPTKEDRMRLVVGLARENVRHNTGGPFGAAIFDMDSKKIIAPGINMVTTLNCSAIHAEICAYILAQQTLNNFDLGAEGLPRCEIVTSVEPCSMCMGATPWSGVRQIVIGARDEDAAAIGFDEGPKMANWVDALESRGIRVFRDVLREAGQAVLNDYAAGAGVIYNGRRKTT